MPRMILLLQGLLENPGLRVIGTQQFSRFWPRNTNNFNRICAMNSPEIPAMRSSDRGAERKPRSERWKEILEAAAKCFFEKGYDATSLQDIAERVGILKGSIYYYIKTKPDLRDALLLEVHKEGLARIQALAATPGNALDKLEAMIRGHMRYISENLEKTSVYLMELKSVEKKGGLLDKKEYRRNVARRPQS